MKAYPIQTEPVSLLLRQILHAQDPKSNSTYTLHQKLHILAGLKERYSALRKRFNSHTHKELEWALFKLQGMKIVRNKAPMDSHQLAYQADQLKRLIQLKALTETLPPFRELAEHATLIQSIINQKI
jgi:hypothetical protein